MRNALYEQTLRKQGVNFDYMERLDLQAIDTKRSLAIQARLTNPIDSELIEQYRELYRDKSESPPIIVWKPNRNRPVWLVLDGNQRVQAARDEKMKTLDAYNINSDDEQVVYRIAWSFNNHVNGRRLSYEESIAHAKSFVRKYGMSTEAAAKEWGVNKHTLGNAVRSDELKEVLQKNNVPVTPSLTDEKIRKLSALTKVGEDVYCMAAQAVAESGATAEEFEPMLKEVKNASTHADKVKVVAEFACSERLVRKKAETKGGKVLVRYSASERIKRYLTDLNNLIDGTQATLLKPGKPHFDALRDLAAEVVDKLTLLYGLGARPQRNGRGGN